MTLPSGASRASGLLIHGVAENEMDKGRPEAFSDGVTRSQGEKGLFFPSCHSWRIRPRSVFYAASGLRS